MVDEEKVHADEAASQEKQKRAENRPYPRKPLSETLKIIHAIKDNNAGKPWAPAQIADAIGRKQRSSDFQYIVAGARDFGLVDGNFRSETLSLTALGKDIAYPPSPQSEKQSLFRAFLSVDIFRQVYEYYKGNALPERKYFENTLIDQFKINIAYIDEFISLFEGNLRYLGVDVKQKVSLEAEVISSVDPQEAGMSPSRPAMVKSGRHRAFVIMPFVEKNPQRPPGFFKEVYKALIEPAAQAAGFDVDWANKPGSDVIQSTIINEVLEADMIIADLTDHNPNVLFELGLRFGSATGPTALVKTSDTGRLFDVDNMLRVYEYRESLWKSTLEIDIPNMEEHFRATWQNRESNETYMNILRRRPA